MAAIFERDFVELKIDIDRMTGGKEVGKRLRESERGGIPWFAFLDEEGKTLATSDGPNGNVGYPAKPEEIEHFVSTLRGAAKRIPPAEIESLEKILREVGAKLTSGRRG